MNQSETNPHRSLPSVDTLLNLLGAAVERWGHEAVTGEIRRLLAELRRRPKLGIFSYRDWCPYGEKVTGW